MYGKKDMNYTCEYLEGGGSWINNGNWSLRETISFYIFESLEPEFYEIHNQTIFKIHKIKSAYDLTDGEFTIYPNQCGTPYVFKPIKL
jgi:hypothetical protein